MSRYRAVTVQVGPGSSGKEDVSTVVVGEAEVIPQIRAEAWLHLAAGWKVWVSINQKRMMAVKGKVTREVFYREYDAMGDI